MSRRLIAASIALAIALTPALAAPALALAADDAPALTSSTGEVDAAPAPEPTPSPSEVAPAEEKPANEKPVEEKPANEKPAEAEPVAPEPAEPEPAEPAAPTAEPSAAPTATPAAEPIVTSPATIAPGEKITLAASNPALFSFAAGLDGSTVRTERLTVSGIADPASGTLLIRGNGECAAPVNEATGAFSCELEFFNSSPELDISAYYVNDGEEFELLGTATVSVLLPPAVFDLESDGESSVLYAAAPNVTIHGRGAPSSGGNATTVRAVIATDEGNVTCITATDNEGTFSCAVATQVFAGEYDLSVTQKPYWSGAVRSLATGGGLVLSVGGLRFVVGGDGGPSDYTLAQGDSLTLNGILDGADVSPTMVVTGTMSIGGSNRTQFVCDPIFEYNQWECTLPTAPTRGGTYTVELALRFDGQLIARDRSQRVVVTGAVVTPAAPTPETTAAPTPAPVVSETPAPEEPLDWKVALGGTSGSLYPGDAFSISSSNLPPGTVVAAEIHSTPISLGSTIVGADGTFTLDTTIPLEIEPGDHTIVVTVTAPGRTPSVSSTPVVVEAQPVAAVDGATDADPAAVPASDVRTRRNVPGAANGVSDSIRPFWETLASPVAIGSAVLAGLVFLVLVAFPAEILTAAVKDRYKFMQRRRGIRAPRRFTWFSNHPVVSGVLLLAVATLISGFADPSFGVDIASLRLLIACFIAALVVSYGAYLLTSWIMNRRFALPTTISLRPYTLIITVIGVILSRVLDFSPGFLFGLMLGLSFPPATSAALRSRARVVRTVMILGVAVISWFAYSFVSAGLASVEPTFGTALLQDTLAALSTEGLTGMLIAMLPFLFLDGHDLWMHSKRVWASIYAVVVVVFFLVVAPKPESWGDLGEKYGPWALVLGVFTVVSLAAYFWLRWDTKRQLGSDVDSELNSDVGSELAEEPTKTNA